MSKKALWLASAGFVVLTASHAFAQAAPDAPAPNTNTTLSEVIVTAEKRSASLQDVPVTLSAYTAETRQLVGIDTLQDFTNFTPGLSYSAANDRVFIRGLGRQTNTNGSDPGVATYTDGIYNASTASVGVSDFFLERTEILRGPQGTLYGRNSIGGAINVISKRPTAKFGGEVRATLGDYGVRNFEASVSGPISDSLRFRLAGANYHQQDGYFENAAGGPSEGGAGNRRYVEAQLEADFGPSLTAWVKAFTSGSGQRPRTANTVDPYDYAAFPAGLVTPGPAFGFTTGNYTQLGSATTNPGQTDVRRFSTDTPQTSHMRDNVGISTEVTWRLPAFDIKYIGGYQKYKYDLSYDLDQTSVTSYVFPLAAGGGICGFIPGCGPLTVNPSLDFNYFEDKKFGSSEINISSNGDGPVQWIGGLYYYAEDFAQEAHYAAPDQPQLRAPANGPANPLGDFVFAGSTIKSRSYAVFGQVDWRLTDSFKLTAGLRYTRDEKEGVENFRILCFGLPACGFTPDQYGAFTPALDITLASISQAAAPGVVAPPTIDPTTGIASRKLSDSWGATTGTLGLEWKPNADILTFARYSRGYKSGGFNAGGISAVPETDPENVNAYELGYKQTFGGRLQVNVGAFYYDYKGLQVPLTVTTPGGANLTQFFNLDKSRSYGVEVEAVWRATHALQLMLSYGYGDSKVQQACCFVDGADPLGQQPGARPVGGLVGGQQPQSLEGQQLPQTPKNKLALNATYTFDFSAGSLALSGSYIWKDETYQGIFNRSYTLTPAYDQVDLRAVWTDIDDRYRVIVFAKNVFDKEGYDNAAGTLYALPPTTTQTVSRNYSFTPPRTVGVQLQYRF